MTVHSTSTITSGNISREEIHLSNIHCDVFSAKCALLGGDNQSETVIKSRAQSCWEASYFEGTDSIWLHCCCCRAYLFFFFFTTPQCWWKTVQLHFAHCVSPRSRCLLRYGDSRSAHVYFWDKTGIKEDKFLDLTMLFVFKHMAGYRFECNTYHKKKKSLGFHLHQYRHLWKQKGMPLGAWKWKIIAKSKYPIIYFLKCSKCCFIDR